MANNEEQEQVLDHSQSMQDIISGISTRSFESEGHISCIRKFSYQFDTEGNINHTFWFADGWADFTRYSMNKGNSFDIKFGERICNQCQIEASLDMGKCNNCVDPNSPFRTRLSCMFNNPDSPLVQKGKCERNNLACSIDKNRRYCHSRHVVYIGRIGNKIKTGISRKHRRGKYISRYVEQGLNEVLTIKDFSSLPRTLEVEQWFEDMGYNTAITFLDKIAELRDNQDRINLLNVFPKSLLKEKFDDHDIEHRVIYPDQMDFPKIEPGDPKHFHGNIFYVQGPVIIAYDDGVCKYWDARDLRHREVKSFEADPGSGRWN